MMAVSESGQEVKSEGEVQVPMAGGEGEDGPIAGEGENVFVSTPELIPDVLSYMFQFCDLDSLKTCRLVSKSWQKAAGPYFRDKTVYDPKSSERLLYCSLESGDYLSEEEDYEDRFVTERFPMGFPYGTVRLPYADHPSEFERERQWLIKWGSKVKGLIFYLEKFGKPHDLVAMRAGLLIDILQKHCKNLQELEIVGCKGMQDADFSASITSKDMCKGKIKRLKFRQIDNENGSPSKIPTTLETKFRSVKRYYTMGSVLKALSTQVEVDVNVEDKDYSCFLAHCLKSVASNVKSIVWRNRLYAQTLFHLRSETPSQAVAIKTIEFSCGLYPTILLSSHMNELITNWGQSLNVLKLDGQLIESWTDEDTESDEDEEIRNLAPQPRHFHLSLPTMEKLTVFELKDIFHTRIESFDFITRFPNLRVLRLSNVTYAADVNPLRPIDVFNALVDSPQLLREPHMNLRVLHLDEFIEQAEFVEAVSKYFPKVQELDLKVASDQAFVEVFKRFKAAVKVTLTFKSVTDISWCQSAFVNFLPSMKDLERLTLKFIGNYHPCLITAEVVKSGFKKCNKLGWFELHNVGIKQTEYDDIVGSLSHLHSLELKNCVFLSAPKSISFTQNNFKKCNVPP